MLKTALDLVPILEAIDVIKNSKLLSKEDRATVLREIARTCLLQAMSLDTVHHKQTSGDEDGPQTKQPTKETRKEHGEQQASGDKPTGSAAQDTRGSRKVSSDDPKGKVARKASGGSRRTH